MFAGPTMPQRLGDAPAVLDQLLVLDRHALDRLAALRLDHRARDRARGSGPSRSQKTSIENSSPAQTCCTIESAGRVAEEELELARGRRRGRCGASRSRGAPSRAPGSATSAGSSSGSHVGGVGDAALARRSGAPRTCPRRARSSRARAAARAPRARRGARRAARWSRSASGTTAATSCSRDERARARRCSPGRRPRARSRAGRPRTAPARARSASTASVVAPARPNALTMSTRCPAQVKRTTTARGGSVPPDAPRLAACAARRATHRDRHRRDRPGRLLPRAPAARGRLDGARGRARRRGGRGGSSAATSGCASVRARHPRPGPAPRARRRRAARGALQPRRREQRRRVVRRPAGDLGVERARRRPPARRDPARQPRHALLPGLLGRDVRLGAGRERRPRRDVARSTRRARTPPRRPPRTCSAAATASRTASGSPAGSSSTTSRAGAAPQFLSRKVVDHVHALRAGRGGRPARARQPEGAARLGLRARLRRRDGRDPPPGRRSAACPTRRASTATTCSAPGGCTPSGSSPTAPSRSPASSSRGSSRATTRSRGRRAFAGSGEPAVVVDPAFIRPVRPAGDRRRPGAGSRPSSAGSRGPGSTASSRTCSRPAQPCSVEEERQLDEGEERRAARA